MLKTRFAMIRIIYSYEKIGAVNVAPLLSASRQGTYLRRFTIGRAIRSALFYTLA